MKTENLLPTYQIKVDSHGEFDISGYFLLGNWIAYSVYSNSISNPHIISTYYYLGECLERAAQESRTNLQAIFNLR